MSDWSGYRLADFMLFSERAYWALFEDLNQAYWPAPLVAIAFGVAALFAAYRRAGAGPALILGLLTLAWGISGWSFVWQRYTTINWAAAYLAPLFAVQALLFLAATAGPFSVQLAQRSSAPARALGGALVLYALLAHPIAAVIDGRTPWSAEVFGFAPLPTALATLGFLNLMKPQARVWLLRAAPLFLVALEWVTLDTLGASSAWVAALGLLAALGGALASHRGQGE